MKPWRNLENKWYGVILDSKTNKEINMMRVIYDGVVLSLYIANIKVFS